MESDDTVAPFWDHVLELRRTILYSLGAVLVGVVITLFFYEEIFHYLTRPLQTIQRTGVQHLEVRRERLFNPDSREVVYVHDHKTYLIAPGGYVDVDKVVPQGLVVFGPVEGMITAFKVCFWLGLILSSPFWIFAILRFIAPALRHQERRLIAPFLVMSALFMGMGCLLAYTITIPLANEYLKTFNATIAINLWSLSHYLNYTLFLILANALAFEMGVILFFLVHLGILTAETMASKRRHMIVLAFILGALLTPPDVLTQFMLAIPLIGLYELMLIYARVKERVGKAKPAIN